MLFLLLLASVSVVFAADSKVEANAKAEVKAEINEELKPAESVHSFKDGLELIRHRDEESRAEQLRLLNGYSHSEDREYPSRHQLDDHDPPGPVILRTPGPLPNQGHPNIEAQNRIIADVFSPDYAQPTWVLDYRYLKSGGRDYTRGPGGQILILPKGVRSKEQKEFPDYDTYIEHLRKSRLSERQHQKYGDHRHNRHGHRDYEDDRSQHGDHGQSVWHKYG